MSKYQNYKLAMLQTAKDRLFKTENIDGLASGNKVTEIANELKDVEKFPSDVLEDIVKTCKNSVMASQDKKVLIDWLSGAKFAPKKHEKLLSLKTGNDAQKKDIRIVTSETGVQSYVYRHSIKFIDSEAELLRVLEAMQAPESVLECARKIVNSEGSDRYQAFDQLKNLTGFKDASTAVELIRLSGLGFMQYKAKLLDGKIKAIGSLRNIIEGELIRRKSETRLNKARTLIGSEPVEYRYLSIVNGQQ
jgi:hypothetical protein